MEIIQGMLWTQEELDIFAPRKKTKRELAKEKKDGFEKKLLERVVLSDEEVERYSGNFNRTEILKYFRKRDNGYLVMIGGDERRYVKPGVEKTLIKTVSKYVDKDVSDLKDQDALVLYRTLSNILETEDKIYSTISKFTKINKLKPFGYSQYEILDYYFKQKD